MGIVPVQEFRVVSATGARRQSVQINDRLEETYPAQARPQAGIPAHLSFALKHEVIHLEFLSRLFHVIEPTGSHAQRRRLLRAREGVKNWLEGPNTDIDRIIRSFSQRRQWQVSNTLKREFPALADSRLARNVVNAFVLPSVRSGPICRNEVR